MEEEREREKGGIIILLPLGVGGGGITNLRVHFGNSSSFCVFQIEDMRLEVQRKEQEMMQMHAKMKTVEEQHADYQKHIAVLKESLIAKEEHYNMLQVDVSIHQPLR